MISKHINLLRIIGLIGGICSGVYTALVTGDVATGAGLIAASFATSGLKAD